MSNLFSKQSPWSCAAAAGTFALLFAACGDEVTEVTEVVGMQVVEEGEAMPKCSADNEGAMVYSVDSAAAYTCIGKKWTSMKGKDGKDGADGKDGKDGADGKDGKNGKNGTNGKDGKNGTNGTDGTSGKSCTAVAIDNGYKMICGEDTVGVVLNGEDGQDGAKGDTGVAGTSCSAKKISDGVKITCTDGKSFTLSNGADGKSFVDGWMVDPRDKQLYRVVTIGEQTWMAENLNYKTENSWCGGGSGENEGDCTKYGRLYLWSAAIDSAKLYKDKALDCGYGKTCSLPDTVYGICPPGWHLPDTTELYKLFTAVGGQSIAGKMLKSQTGWDRDYNGTDAFGFTAIPAGQRDDEGNFSDKGIFANFWSATEYSEKYAYCMFPGYVSEDAFLKDNDCKNCAYSVRCIKD